MLKVNVVKFNTSELNPMKILKNTFYISTLQTYKTNNSNSENVGFVT